MAMYQPADNTVKKLFDLSGNVSAVTGGVREGLATRLRKVLLRPALMSH